MFIKRLGFCTHIPQVTEHKTKTHSEDDAGLCFISMQHFLRKVKKFLLKELEPLGTSWRERNRAKLTRTHSSLWWLLWTFLQGNIVVVGAKSVIKGSVCHAKINFWIAGKWIKESVMAAACANATLPLCTWRAGELLLLSPVVFRLNKMQQILQKEEAEKDF